MSSPCPYFVSPPYNSCGSIAPRAQVMVPRNIWALSDPCDSFPGRVISSELAGSSSFPRSSLPKARIPVKTARAGLWLGFSLFLVPPLPVSQRGRGSGTGWDEQPNRETRPCLLKIPVTDSAELPSVEITGCPWPSSVRPAAENDNGVRIKQAESALKIDHSPGAARWR